MTVFYNFYLGTGSHLCTCSTKEDGTITSVTGSLNVQDTYSDPPSSAINYTIHNITNLYEEILQIIRENEINSIQFNTNFDEDALLKELLEQLEYDLVFHDDTDSDNLFGYSDIVSVSSQSTFCLDDVSRHYQEILLSIQNTDNLFS